MRERDELDVAVKAVRELESGVRDNLELIELGEAEGDSEIVRDAEEAIFELRLNARRRQIETCCQARSTPMTAMWKSILAPAGPRARIGPICCCACIRAGQNGGR